MKNLYKEDLCRIAGGGGHELVSVYVDNGCVEGVYDVEDATFQVASAALEHSSNLILVEKGGPIFCPKV